MFSQVAMTLGLLALSFPYLRQRIDMLRLIRSNAPESLQKIAAFSSREVKFQNVIRNCEDLYMNDESGFVILSCDPGRDEWNTVMGQFVSPSTSGALWLYNYTSSLSNPPIKLRLNDYPPNRDFHPLGLEYVSSARTLYAANHKSNGSCIEIFRLDAAARSLSYIRTLADPKLHAPNAIRALSDHELLVSNDHYFLQRSSAVLALAETYLAAPGGSVAYVNLRSGVVAHVARLPFANGIAVVNGTVVAVASTSTPAV
ncbi:hypothetical protein LTS18_001565, partial [Coniosporium uncinatum]